jgi:hypothetical protein
VDEVSKLKAQLLALRNCMAAFLDGYDAGEHGGLEACPFAPEGEQKMARLWWLRGHEMASAVRERRFLRAEVARLRRKCGEDPS